MWDRLRSVVLLCCWALGELWNGVLYIASQWVVQLWFLTLVAVAITSVCSWGSEENFLVCCKTCWVSLSSHGTSNLYLTSLSHKLHCKLFCIVALSQGCFTYHHNQALNCLAGIELSKLFSGSCISLYASKWLSLVNNSIFFACYTIPARSSNLQ